MPLRICLLSALLFEAKIGNPGPIGGTVANLGAEARPGLAEAIRPILPRD
jgi:hypothetical protein